MTAIVIIPEIRHIRPIVQSEQERTYRASLELVARIDENLTRGVKHYRTRTGLLLTTLDEVVRAIVAGNLMELEG